MRLNIKVATEWGPIATSDPYMGQHRYHIHKCVYVLGQINVQDSINQMKGTKKLPVKKVRKGWKTVGVTRHTTVAWSGGILTVVQKVVYNRC